MKQKKTCTTTIIGLAPINVSVYVSNKIENFPISLKRYSDFLVVLGVHNNKYWGIRDQNYLNAFYMTNLF